jgi:signal transduction histidine kinase
VEGVQRELVLSEWEVSVRRLPAAEMLDEPSLVEGMAQILSTTLDWIERGRREDLETIERLARIHVDERLREGFDLRQMVAEYRILRASILRLLVRQCQDAPHAEEVLVRVVRLDEGIDAAVAELVDRSSETRARTARAAELQLRRIVATLPVAVWVADAAGNIVLSNEAARRLWAGDLRVSIEEYDRFKAWFPDGRRIRSAEWGLARALRTGEVIVDEELKIETFDGTRKIIRNSAAPIVDDSGRIVGGVAVNEDITFLKRAEATRDLFAGILGHDLRNPLNAITMAVALLLRSQELAEPQRHTVLRIQSSAARIRQLIDSLLDLTRARFGMGFPIDRAAADMGEISARIVDELRTAYPGRTIELRREGDLGGSWDAGRVAQVLSNLVGNAVQHGADPITVEAKDAGEAVRVSVSNRGVPLSDEQRVSLFEPFRKGGDSTGIGLGLFIAREIVRAHGGTIDVASTDAGTTFTTRWPRATP